MSAVGYAAPVSLGSPQFHSVENGPLLVTEAVFPAGHRLAKHHHDRTVVGITLAGNWDSVVGATRLQNAPGMLHVEPAGDPHINQFGSQDAHILIIQPDPANLELVQPFKSLLETALHVRVALPGILMAQRLRGELLAPDELTPLAMEGMFFDLLISASRSSRTGPAREPLWLRRAVDYLHAHFLEQPTLPELGKIAGVSPEHFNREFCRHFRTGAAEYLRGLRLNWAAERLRTSGDPIAEIAYAAGFADQSHFTRRFRRQFGTTPAALRATFRASMLKPPSA